ncbi:MlaC/ttg2D family ABC transporter substrate-binding protein [Sulfuriferula plumbiphila]|uniref:MlaC/ttg2D family ABC transporter substrate-binding protein n=2 Tax=Sulfuriferula plumbiphila TaxID=171865 RepID=UPI0038CD7F67
MKFFAGAGKWLVAGLAALSLLVVAHGQAAGADVAPDVLVKTTTQEVVAILKKDKDIQAGDTRKIYELVDAKILPNFDFNHMTMLAVGKYWPRATPAQRQLLIQEFRTLLVRTYASSLTAFNNQAIEFKPFSMAPEATDVTVQTQVKQPGAQPIPIDYSMEKTPFGWKVYDVAIDGVSLVTNYRSSFGSEIRQSGIDGLIRTLASRNQQNAVSQQEAPAVKTAPAKKTRATPK